jgi:tetratricopeptide (TPR) repeat protein
MVAIEEVKIEEVGDTNESPYGPMYAKRFSEEWEEPKDQKCLEWLMLNQPWALKDPADQLKAYKDLLDCDFQNELLKARGTRDFMAQGPKYAKLMHDLKHDPMTLQRAILGGEGFGMQCMAVLSAALKRRLKLPKPRPDKPPESAAEAKAYATKLFTARKFPAAADMYDMAIRLLDVRPQAQLVLKPTGDAGAPVGVVVTAHAVTEQQRKDEEMAPALFANLAACRVKQHRWKEAIAACDEALLRKPDYTKAMMRRATAFRALKQLDASVRECDRALKCAGDDEALKTEINNLKEAVNKEVAKAEAERLHEFREQNGIELCAGMAYGHDLGFVLKRILVDSLVEPMVFIEEIHARKNGMCRAVDPVLVDGPGFSVDASVRARGGRRFLYYLIDISVPWRGFIADEGQKPHWLHDQFEGIVRIGNVTHATDPDDWAIRVEEKPVDPKDIPTCTPGGHPIEPLVPLVRKGEENKPRRRHNDIQERLFYKYGPELAKKLKVKVQEAIEALKEHVGDGHRVLV